MAYYNSAYDGQPQVQYQAPIVYYAAPTITYQHAVISRYGPHYERQTSTGLGATQIVLACISIAAGVMAIMYDAQFSWLGIGIWAGAFYLIAGSLALSAGKDTTDNLIKATLVFSVFDIGFGITQVTFACLGVSAEVDCESDYYNYCSNWMGAAIAANSMMIAVGALEIIFGIWLTVVSARAINKGSKAQQLATIPVTYAPHQLQPVFIQAPPSFQPQPPFLQPQPPPYYDQQQYPTSSDPQQMMYVGVHQAPLTSSTS